MDIFGVANPVCQRHSALYPAQNFERLDHFTVFILLAKSSLTRDQLAELVSLVGAELPERQGGGWRKRVHFLATQ
jgi:hypothetical protein